MINNTALKKGIKMSGLFNIDYEKAGPGIPEDGTQENGFIRFFSILQRKFWALISLNLMQVLFSLPAFAVSAFFFSYMYKGIMTNAADIDLSYRIFVGFTLIAMQLVTIGPFQAGFVYVLRNYAREENAYVWSDFIKGIKENYKRALAVTVIDLVVVFLVSYVYMFYTTNAAGIGAMSQICQVILIIFAVIYAMIHMYIYPMMVTLDLTVKQLYGNAIRFAVAKFLPNLLILAVIIAFCLLIFINTMLGIFVLLLIGYSLTGFISTFYAYGAIDKYIIQRIKA